MANIILATDSVATREIILVKERITIGRSPHNDIVIDDRAISAEHAVIVTIDGDSFLEDLNSTNGTQVNGQPVKKHFLQDGDAVELAGYRIAYTGSRDDGSNPVGTFANFRERGGRGALIRILSGPSAGRETMLTKHLTTIGQPGVQVAAITRHAQRYFLAHVEGINYPLLNGRLINTDFMPISNGDVIEIGGTRMQVFLGERNLRSIIHDSNLSLK